MFDLSEATTRRYIRHFNEAGLPGPSSRHSLGRPLEITWTQAEWLDVLAQLPADLAQLETAAQNWTLGLVKQYLAIYHQIKVAPSTIVSVPPNSWSIFSC